MYNSDCDVPPVYMTAYQAFGRFHLGNYDGIQLHGAENPWQKLKLKAPNL